MGEVDGDLIQLEAKNLFAAQILNNEFNSAFAKAINKTLNTRFNIKFFAKGSLPQTSNNKQEANPLPATPIVVGINNNYSFDNFVVGEFNKTAYNAAQSLFKKMY
jgi:chromosomal replication initiation ATPase DnaA